MLRRFCAAFAFLGLVLTPIAFAETPNGSLISAADLLKIKQLGSPVFSPDGSLIVYTVKSIEEKSGRPGEYVYRTHLWITNRDGIGNPRQLTRGEASASAPAWHPNGDRIAFVRTEKERSQIWILPVGPGGEAFPVTKLPHGGANPRWSPDGTQLLFTAVSTLPEIHEEVAPTDASALNLWPSERPGVVAGDPPASLKQPLENADATSLETRRLWLAQNEFEENPRVTSRLEFLDDNGLDPIEQFNRLYIVAAEENAKPKLITPGYTNVNDAAWLPTAAGSRVVMSGYITPARHPDRRLEQDLWIINTDGLHPQRILHQDGFAFTEPEVSPDGSGIAFISEDIREMSYGRQLVGVIAPDGSNKRILSESLDRSASRLKWSRDGAFIYFIAAANGGYPLYRVSPAGGSVERLTGFYENFRSYDLSPRDICAVFGKYDNPYELFRFNLSGDARFILSAHNSVWLQNRVVARPEYRRLTVDDGTKIDAWLAKPTRCEPGRRYPLLVMIHGGPQGMWGPGTAGIWHELQFFAARGYGVLFCNPRGSTGYGHDFQKLSFQDWGPGPAADVLAAVNHAIAEPWVDREKLVIGGGSYGGYLTVWIISHDHRFKAAIAQRGIYDLRTFFGEGSAWRIIPGQFGGYPWQPEIRRMLDAQSPLSHVTGITTPLMIKHGDNDHRAGISQSEMLYRSLKVLNRPVEYVRYPGAGHELSRNGDPLQRIDRLVRFDEFFQRFIGPLPTP